MRNAAAPPIIFILSLGFAFAARCAPEPTFIDPKPPLVHPLIEGATENPVPVPEVRFHTPPKKLDPEAMVHDWTDFLGPTHDGVSTESPLLVDWGNEGPRLVWEMEKGDSYSAPAIKADRLVFPHRVGDEVRIDCLHPETGEGYWRQTYESKYRDRYGYNNGPRCSPVIDEDRVYILGADGVFLCLDLGSGHVLWRRYLNDEFGVPQDFFGVSSTPLLHGDMLIVQVGAPAGPGVAAFDKRDGRMLWGVEREWGPSYASPVPATIHGKTRVLVFAGGDSDPPTGGLLGIDPDKGTLLFRHPWRSRSYESVNASRPAPIGDKVFISASYQTGSALLRVTPEDEIEEVWKTDEVGVHFSNTIHRDGHLYAFDGRNEGDASLVCVEVETGRVVWRESPTWKEKVVRRGRETFATRGILRGSFLHAQGRFLCLGELGSLHWLDLSPDGYRELARVSLFDSPQTWTPPVLSRGLLYICQNYQDFNSGKPPRLLCYDLRAE